MLISGDQATRTGKNATRLTKGLLAEIEFKRSAN